MVIDSQIAHLKPPITWFGSKSRLVKHIVRHFPKHRTFVDVFGGSGAILLGKRPSPVEVYNDINRKLAALFRVLSDPGQTKELFHSLEMTPYSRDEFLSCRDSINYTDNDIELARQMIVIQRQSHGGLGKNWSYCVDASNSGYSASVRKFHAGIERLPEISKRLRKVQIENIGWREILKRYDRPGTLFYLDPPYVPETRIKGGYEHEMSIDDHSALTAALLSINGMAVLSGYPNSIYEPLEQAGWKRVEIETLAYVSQERSKRTECLWISPVLVESREYSQSRQDINNDLELEGLTNRQRSAYCTHRIRTNESEAQIKSAIKTLNRLGKKVTKAEVSRMTGISRTHISRRYTHLFNP